MLQFGGWNMAWLIAQAAAPVAEKPEPPGAVDLIGQLLLPVTAIGMLFYFMIYRPDQRKRQAHENLLKEMKKNDRVVTIGGILGTLVSVQKDSDEVTIKVDDSNNTKIRMLRSSIARVLIPESGEKKDVDN